MATDRTKVRRIPERGVYDRDEINQILDSAFLCHVAFNADHGPVVLPTLFGRHGDTLYIHGSSGAHMLREMRKGIPVSVAVTHVDGIVVARSHFHNSINYRSVVVFGTATEVTDVQEKMLGLEVVTNHILPGRWDEGRKPSTTEFTQTMVMKLSLDESSAKVRTGGPKDEAEDMDMTVWAGVLPVGLRPGELVPDPALKDGVPVSDSVTTLIDRLKS